MYNKEEQTEGRSPNKQGLFTIQTAFKLTESELTAHDEKHAKQRRKKRDIHVKSSRATRLGNVNFVHNIQTSRGEKK